MQQERVILFIKVTLDNETGRLHPGLLVAHTVAFTLLFAAELVRVALAATVDEVNTCSKLCIVAPLWDEPPAPSASDRLHTRVDTG